MDSNPYSNVSWQFNSYMNYRNNCFQIADWFDQYKNIVLIISVLFSLDNHGTGELPRKLYSFGSEFKKSKEWRSEVHVVCFTGQSRRSDNVKDFLSSDHDIYDPVFGTNGFKSLFWNYWLSIDFASKTRSIVREQDRHVHMLNVLFRYEILTFMNTRNMVNLHH
jgi:hypothetical protein